MTTLQRTVLYDRHVALGAKMVEFGGWEMPVQYENGIVQEHLSTRKEAGLFDVSHMGRFIIRGKGALPFLQHLLTNNAAALDVGRSQYTMIPNEQGGAIDDAYLYRFVEDRYLLVVNAANRSKDWDYLHGAIQSFPKTEMADHTEEMAMLSLQGPQSKNILNKLIGSGSLPEPLRNALSSVKIGGRSVFLSRTGYTGEPICFEMFLPRESAVDVWGKLLDLGAVPVGLGARDTLRLEAGLPLYGHELGKDIEGGEIPIFTCHLARFAVSFSPLKGEYIGRAALGKQFEAYRRFIDGNFDRIDSLPRMLRHIAVIDKGIVRAGGKVYSGATPVGYVTSGTMVPYWRFEGEGIASRITDEKGMRAIGLALLDSRAQEGDEVEFDIRGKRILGRVVPYHLRSEAPPYARAILYAPIELPTAAAAQNRSVERVKSLLKNAVENTRWRRMDCINLIPSEQTPSPMTRRLSILDPVGRYAEIGRASCRERV